METYQLVILIFFCPNVSEYEPAKFSEFRLKGLNIKCLKYRRHHRNKYRLRNNGSVLTKINRGMFYFVVNFDVPFHGYFTLFS